MEGFVLFGCLAAILTGVLASEQSLVIQPNVDMPKAVGMSLALTCRPNVQNPGLISELEWRDEKNRRITNNHRDRPLYIQTLVNERGLVLIFPSLTENQAGEYSCHAFYSNTERLSSSVKIKTYVPISFVDAPENQYPIAGRDYKIKCKVQGNPAPFMDWNKNDALIETNNKYVIMNDELLVKNVTEADDGEYKCTAVVISTGQFKSRTIKVEVQVPPKILPMSSVTVIEGETASTSCKATGKPPPRYKWIKENTRQDLAVTDRFGVKDHTGDLIINRVEYLDNSLYTCIAENPAGRANSTVRINVLVKPKIYELWNVTAAVNTETKIICKAYGRPPPKVTFRKLSNQKPFPPNQNPEDPRIILEQQQYGEKGETYGTLIITSLNRSDDGLYECIATNEAATAYKNGHIAVEFPPTFERTKDLPPFWSWEGRPGNLSCLPEAIPNATVIWRYNGIQIEDSNIFNKTMRGAQSFLIVNANKERRFYTKYECVATNKLGEAKLKIELKQATVPAIIQEVRPESITATTIKFNIYSPNNFDGLPLRSFTVQYRDERTIQWDFALNHTWSYGASYILEGLIPEVTYFFRFAARNDVGMGAFTNIAPVTMPRRSEPAEPKILVTNHNMKDENSSNRQDVTVLSAYSDHFELKWSVPVDNGDPIQHYLIRYCVTEKIAGEWRDSECSEQIPQSVQYTSYQLNTLQPDTTYKIELRAHNAIGDSSPAQIRVKTPRGADPSIPMAKAQVSSSTIIGIVIGAVLIILILVDITCFCCNRTGIIALLCDHSKSKHHEEEDPKLGSYKAAPAHPNSLNLPQPIKLAPSPTEEREPLKHDTSGLEKPMTVEYDGRQILSKSGEIIGKHSAV